MFDPEKRPPERIIVIGPRTDEQQRLRDLINRIKELAMIARGNR